MYVQGKALPEMYTDIIASELNVKEVMFVDDASGFVSYKVKPQLKTLGPKYGKLLRGISAYLAEDNIGDIIVATHTRGEDYSFEIDGTTVVLSSADVLVETKKREGFISECMDDLAVVLNTELTDELIDEGMLREVVSKIQNMRKDAGFEVVDHIAIGYSGKGRMDDVIKRFEAEIKSETLADEIANGIADDGFIRDWEINGETITISVSKLK